MAALEHCDALVSGHSYAALAEVVEAIGAPSDRLGRAPAETFVEPPETDETWASATPVPGQLGRDAERLRAEQGQDDPGMVGR